MVMVYKHRRLAIEKWEWLLFNSLIERKMLLLSLCDWLKNMFLTNIYTLLTKFNDNQLENYSIHSSHSLVSNYFTILRFFTLTSSMTKIYSCLSTSYSSSSFILSFLPYSVKSSSIDKRKVLSSISSQNL